MVNFSLEKKIALITGASRGIGEAIALTLAEYGARCILVSRKLAGLEAVREKIEHRGGQADAIAFGELFIANPDLPERVRRGGPYTDPDPSTYYGGDAKGYTDYPSLTA